MTFIDICKLPQEQLKAKLEEKLTDMGYKVVNEDGFLFAEGDVPVMLTAHMDTVHKDNCTIVCVSEDGNYVMSPQGIGGDDRCGIFMALEIIKQRRCSILFTEDEEIGCVGAHKFCKTDYKPEKLNYIIEFDRKNGDDAVFYSCDNPDFTKFCTDGTGFKEERGSCSDISHVAPHLGVAAVNFSCGYYSPHTCHEYVNMKQMLRNIERAIAIIDKPCEKFEYIEKKYAYSGSSTEKKYDYYWLDSYWKKSESDKTKNVSNLYDYEALLKEQEEEEIAYKKAYGCEDEPVWDFKCTIEVMVIDPDVNYIEDSEGNTYAITDDYQYFLDMYGNVYYGLGLNPLMYLVDGKAKTYDGKDLKYDDYLSLDGIEVTYEDWQKVSEYYNKLAAIDMELNTDLAYDYLVELESLASYR